MYKINKKLLLRIFIFLGFVITSIDLSAQSVYWLHQDNIEHDRTDDLKWWELEITNDDSAQIIIDSSSTQLKCFLVKKKEQNNLEFMYRQKSIALKPGQHHIYIFHYFVRKKKGSNSIKIILRGNTKEDTVMLNAIYAPENFQSDRHPGEKNLQMRIFPRVSSGLFKIDIQPLRNAEVIVYDSLRSIVHQTDWSGRLLDLRGLQAGRYTIQVNDKEFPVNIIEVGKFTEENSPNTRGE